MKSAKSVFENYAKREGFLKEIVKRLDENNPNLENMIVETMELEKEANAKDRVFEMMLLSSEIMGLTDPGDPDFVRILPEKKLRKYKSTLTNVPKEYFTKLLPFLHKLNEDINKKEASEGLPVVPFSNVWSKILKMGMAEAASKTFGTDPSKEVHMARQ